MPDPKEVFNNDQRKAAFADLGASFARMLRALVDEGIPLGSATAVVAGFARGAAEATFQKKPEGY